LSQLDSVEAVIETVLKKYPKAKHIAVENFLATSVEYNYDNQVRNLYLDASLYQWNSLSQS